MTCAIPRSLSLDLYRRMARIRRFETRVCELKGTGQLRGPLHLSIGMEAVAVGTCGALRPDDYITSTHRGHHHLIAKGGRLDRMMAELFGRAGGYCRGKGGSMHLAASELGILGANGIVGGGLPIAAGAALSAKRLARDLGDGRVAACFFGDGAANQGLLAESLNLAAAFALPAIYVCENNLYGAGTPFGRVSKNPDVAARAGGLGVPSRIVDGQDVSAVYEAVKESADRARAGKGPTLVECKTYRFLPHTARGREGRDPQEVETWKQRDPLVLYAESLVENGHARRDELEDIDREVDRELEEAVRFAEQSPVPDPSEAATDVYAGPAETPPAEPAQAGGGERTLTYRESLREALAEEMRRDARVILLGEEVPRGYRTLADEFGADRVMDMPISEPGFTGMGVGAALTGLRPVVEVMFDDFITLATDQIVNQAAKARYMFGGDMSVPMVILTNAGGYASTAAQHSQMLESWFSHVPGLKVLVPATPCDMKGLVKAAVRDDNPVLVFFHKKLMGLEGPVPEADYVLPIGRAAVRRPGRDVTVVAYSYMTQLALEAAGTLEGEGVDAEVIDLRSTLPIDTDAILSSVCRTRRLVVVQEAPAPCSVGSEVAALVAENALTRLAAPVRRVHAQFAPVPFAPSLERAVLPEAESIVHAIRQVLSG